MPAECLDLRHGLLALEVAVYPFCENISNAAARIRSFVSFAINTSQRKT